MTDAEKFEANLQRVDRLTPEKQLKVLRRFVETTVINELKSKERIFKRTFWCGLKRAIEVR